MDSKVAVVILNWNGRDFLEQFLQRVIDYSKDIAEVVVADNDSSDDSIIYLRENFPDIRLIQNQINGGFAKGYNDALKQIDADYYILLNSDIEVTPNWIQPVIELMEKDPEIAACQPKLMSYYERENFEYAGAAGGFIDKYGYPFCRGRLFQTLESDGGQYDDVTEIFWATGACLFVRAEVYHKHEGFDERFFAHMEEIDFCWRAKNDGYKIMFCPDSTVYHIGGGTLPKKSWKKTYLNMRNNNIMLYKNISEDRLRKVFLARLFLDGVAAIKFLFDGGVMDMYAVIKAHWKFFFMIPQLRRERWAKEPQAVTKIYQKNLVTEYFILRKKTFGDLHQDLFS